MYTKYQINWSIT